MADVEVPFRVQFPPGWTAVDPAAAGAPNVVLAATRDEVTDGFASNVLIAVTHAEGEVDLLTLADAAAGRLAADVDELTVADRGVLGEAEYAGIAQVLHVRAAGRTLVQSQVHLLVPVAHTDTGLGDQLIVELTCTCPESVAAAVRPEFAAVVDSLHIATA